MASALFHSQKCYDLDDALYGYPCKKEHGSVAEMEEMKPGLRVFSGFLSQDSLDPWESWSSHPYLGKT